MLEQIAPVQAPASYLGTAARKLIMVSNRGPVEHYFDDSGRIRRREACRRRCDSPRQRGPPATRDLDRHSGNRRR